MLMIYLITILCCAIERDCSAALCIVLCTSCVVGLVARNPSTNTDIIELNIYNVIRMFIDVEGIDHTRPNLYKRMIDSQYAIIINNQLS